MLLIGYFEGIDSQRGIAWRCSDSLSLRRFLQVPLDARTPDHSSLTRVRDRLPLEIHQQVFAFVLSLAGQHKLLGKQGRQSKAVAIDTTLREASAAMRSIVRKESGEDWKASLTRQMKEEGRIEEDDEPTDEELRTFDKGRKNKTVSNREWESASDSESRIAKMKDGRSGSGGAASDSGFAASESHAASPTPARLADVALRMREVQQALPTRRRSAEPGAADAEGRLFLLSARFFRLQCLAVHWNPRRTPPPQNATNGGFPEQSGNEDAREPRT